MSFGFGVGDIILVSNGIAKFWTTVRDAPTEQADLKTSLEFLRQVVQTITDRASKIALNPTGPTAKSLEPRLSQCFKHLRNLDNIATKYMGHDTAYVSSRMRKRRLLLWGACKRDEFVQAINELGKIVLLLLSIAMFEGLQNNVPLALADSPASQSIRFIDALDRESVCSFRLCDTWEVCLYPPMQLLWYLWPLGIRGLLEI